MLADGPSVYYRLGDTSAAVMADSSGNGANGVYNAGNVTLGASGPLAGDPGLAVSSAGQYVGFSRPGSLPLYSHARTVEAWMKTTTSGERYLAGWGVQATGEAFDVGTDANHVYVEGYSDTASFTSATTLDDGNWHFVVVSTNGTTASAYVDGVSLGTQTFPSPLNTISSGELVIGGETNQTDGIAGTLAQLAIYPTALTAAQVQAQFAAANYLPTAPGAPAATAGVNRASVSWTAASAANAPVEGYLVTALKGGVKQEAVSVAAARTAPWSAGYRAGRRTRSRSRRSTATGTGPRHHDRGHPHRAGDV